MKKTVLLFVVVLLCAFNVQSQNMERPWLVGVSTNYADFNAVEMSVGDQATHANWMGQTLPSQLKIGRILNKSFAFSAEYSFVKLEPDKSSFTPGNSDFINIEFTTDKFWRLNGQFEYRLANGYLLKEKARLDPYLFLGLNGSRINEKTYLAQVTGVGLNIWFTDWLGINGEGSYDYIFDWNDYFHYSMGIVVRFGKKNDMDKDGISNKKDLCPEIPGIAEFQGCPDADGDGIPDKDDKCPRVAGPKATFGCPDKDGDGVVDDIDKCLTIPGPAELSGCPDKDNDGIADNEDLCPDVKGPASTKGCPDTDGDGILDNDDLCPNEKGPVATNGCPDSDGDGIPDKNDNCPNEKGVKENNGCPKITQSELIPVEQPTTTLELKDVYFEVAKSNVKSTSMNDLENALNVMKANPRTRFSIYGYTDNTGNVEYNLNLSKDRANSVWKYFIDKGITGNRLVVDGFGINNPKATNDTPEGREMNRRVEIRTLK